MVFARSGRLGTDGLDAVGLTSPTGEKLQNPFFTLAGGCRHSSSAQTGSLTSARVGTLYLPASASSPKMCFSPQPLPHFGPFVAPKLNNEGSARFGCKNGTDWRDSPSERAVVFLRRRRRRDAVRNADGCGDALCGRPAGAFSRRKQCGEDAWCD